MRARRQRPARAARQGRPRREAARWLSTAGRWRCSWPPGSSDLPGRARDVQAPARRGRPGDGPAPDARVRDGRSRDHHPDPHADRPAGRTRRRRRRAARADDVVPAEPAGRPGRRPRGLRCPARHRWPAHPGHSGLSVRLVGAPRLMTDVSRRQRVATGLAWVLVVAVALAGIAGNVLAWRYLATSDAISSAAEVPAAILYATLGALIVRRAGNVVGWFLLSGGMATAVVSLASAYAAIGTKNPGALPGAALAGLLAECSFVLLVSGIAFMFLLFPTGHLPSRRWRPAGALCLLLIALALIETAIHPGPIGLPVPGGVSVVVQNPLGVRPLPGPLLVIGTISALWAVFLAVEATSTAAMITRYRSGDREQRQQIKWIAFTAAAMIACALVVIATSHIAGTWPAVLTAVADTTATVIGLAGFPIAIAVAVLKYGLYQIDVIITRAVSYGLLSAALTAVYAGIVVGIGTLAGYAGGPVLTVAAAVVVAVLFHPVRQRAAVLANRLVYGKRSSPYQVLAGFAQDMAGQLDADAAPSRLAALLAGATSAVRVEVFVVVGDGLVSRAVWPEGAEPAAPPAVPPAVLAGPVVADTARLLRVSQ